MALKVRWTTVSARATELGLTHANYDCSERCAAPAYARDPASTAVVLVPGSPRNTRPWHALTARIDTSPATTLASGRTGSSATRAASVVACLPARAAVAARAAVRVATQRRFASVRDAAGTIVITSLARRDLAAASAAAARGVRRVACSAAASAVIVGVEWLFAAVVYSSVAVAPAAFAAERGALAGVALCARHAGQGCAVVAAASAVGDFGEVGLAAVVALAIAVGEAAVAAGDRALAGGAARDRMIVRSALDAAAGTIARRRQIGLAAIGGIAVAIGFVRRALYRAAAAAGAGAGRPARVVAGAAVLGVVAQADAAVAAVRERGLAGDEPALARLAAGFAAIQRAARTAASAIACPAQRGLAAIGVDAVAVAPAVLAAYGGGALPAVPQLVRAAAVIDHAGPAGCFGPAGAVAHVLERAAGPARAAVGAGVERLLAAALRSTIAIEVALEAVDNGALARDANAL
jgi:hypothetical protein